MKSKIKHFYHREKYRVTVSALAAVLVGFVYLLGNKYPPGMLSYVTALPAMIGVVITALARVNDIGPDRTSWSWQMRRIGLTMTGATAVAFLYAPFSAHPTFPTWLSVVGWWGFFTVWLTTPGMPPWHKYIFGSINMKEPRHVGD